MKEKVICMDNKKCHIFTPEDIVIKMLDEIGYVKGLYGKKFLENSCGIGNILGIAIDRYIKDCLNIFMTIDKIKYGLEKDFFGIEYDKKNHEKCIENLNKIVAIYGIKNVKWNIVRGDYLSLNLYEKYDFIVGNPPYIAYSELSLTTRNYIRENFKVCKNGKFDYYYPFIEKSINSLSKNGRLAYLIPTNIFKNVFARDLRLFIKGHISKIFDYTTRKIFKNILTSSSIIVCEMNKSLDNVEYHDISRDKKFNIDKKNLGDKWIFNNTQKREKILFSEYFLAATSVATLYNNAFVIKNFVELNDSIISLGINLEKEIIKKAASPRSLSKNKEELIIFPYYYIENKLFRYSETEFRELFPGVSSYLSKFKNNLNKRNVSSYINWFEYGRTQAIEKLNQRKLLMSFIITDKLNIYDLDKDTIPYSGIYIVPISDVGLEKAIEILSSDKFLEYVKSIGIHVSGSSIRITANDIKNFDISDWR